MLTWLSCRFAPRLGDFTDVGASELPEPLRQPELVERARAVLAELAQVPFTPRGETNPFRLLMGMGCRDLVTREADQHSDTAGRTANFARFPQFQPLEVPGDGATLHGHHSVGAPGAPVVIVVHGLFDSHVSGYVVEYAEVLRRWGFHVVALDLRGHGRLRGTPPPTSLGLFEGKDLFVAARTLSEAEGGVSVGILGLSFGGHCAVRAAYEASKAGRADVLRGGVLSLCAPLNVIEAVNSLDDTSRLPHPKRWLDRRIMGQVHKVFRRHLQLRVADLPVTGRFCEDFEGYLREAVLPAYPGEPGLVGAFAGKARSTQPEVWSKIALPVGLVHAADDPLVPVGHLREARRQSGDSPWIGARELPGGGHVSLHHVDPEGTALLLATFFGRLRDG